MTNYARPNSLGEAIVLLSRGGWQILAGGTDVYPAIQTRQITRPVIDITRLHDLQGISVEAEGVRIGACTNWSVIANATLPPAMAALQQAARQVGGWQIQNSGTLGGNLCNASPAADGVPPLLVLEAEVELASASGTRRLPLSDFLTGPRQTAREVDELLVAVHVPATALAGRSSFLKLGARAYLVISIAMVAARVVMEGGRISGAALAVGACSATARRLPRIEAALVGRGLDDAAAAIRDEDVAAALSPMDDLRASAAYRAEAAAELLRRAVAEVTA